MRFDGNACNTLNIVPSVALTVTVINRPNLLGSSGEENILELLKSSIEARHFSKNTHLSDKNPAIGIAMVLPSVLAVPSSANLLF